MAAIIAQNAGNFAAKQAALNDLGPYQGRGKGRTKVHDHGGTRAHQRVALKKRNVARHRKACRA